MHPKERRSLAATRREFLARTGGAAFALSGASGLLAACSNSTTTAGSTVNSAGQAVGPGGLPLARPDNPVKLPLWEDPIKSGLKPETGGTFTVYNYPAYLYKKLLNEFCAKYDVTPQYTPFEATEHLNQGRSPPKRQGVHARAMRCSTSSQSSP